MKAPRLFPAPVLWLLLTSICLAATAAGAQPTQLRCEHEENPLAVEARQPRLSWVLDAGANAERGASQTAYQLLVSSTEAGLAANQGDLWDTAKVVSGQSVLVPYGGKPLQAAQTVLWKVRVWNEHDQPSDWSTPARFSVGLLASADWSAKWITADSPKTDSLQGLEWVWAGQPDERMMYPPGARFFRRAFAIPEDAQIAQAQVRMTADNSFTLFINGHEALSGQDYGTVHSAQVATYLCPGVNQLAVTAANGGTGPNEAGLLGRLDITLADGKTLAVPVDATWKAHKEAKSGWEYAGFNDAEWAPVRVLGKYGMKPWGELSAPPAPLPLFRHEFTLTKPVRRAVVHVCGLGHYELHLNGGRVGDYVLTPEWTDYRDTCSYNTYDVTAQLAAGTNALGVLLGNGMYNVTGGRYVKFKGSFGPPKLILQLEVEHPDGTTTRIASDASWKTAPGPLTLACIYGGEDYDARREVPGWDRAGFDDHAWTAATLTESPGGALRAQLSPPIRIHEELKTVRVTEPKPGLYVYDLGKNFSGWPKLTVRGRAGATVKLTPGELLAADGTVSQRSSGGPTWFAYTLRGANDETWSPRFSYYGFRYVQVEGAAPLDDSKQPPDYPRIAELQGQFLYSSAPVAGDFACSNELVNQVHRLILAAIRCNLQSVLTDCPHREKLGWLEVSHLLADGLTYNFQLPRFYAKVSRDMRESQIENGLVPDIAPEYTVFSAGFRDSPEWGSACAFNPAHMFLTYGDASLLTGHSDVIARYAAYLGTTAKDHIVAHGLGDWYDIGPNPPGESQLTSKGLTATAVYCGDLKVLEQAARLQGKADEATRYAGLAEEVRRAFHQRFFDRAGRQYDRGSQTAQAMPLVLGMVDRELQASVIERLVRAITTNHYRVTAGDVGFSYVVRALTDAGRDDLLYRMVTQTNGPGYADQLRKGATTLTEAWDASPDSSNNHCMLGHAEGWLYSGLAGIRPDPQAPGFKRFVIRPTVVGDLTWVKAHYDSPYGRITSAWRREGDQLTLEVTVPPNSTAAIFVPTGDPAAVRESGQTLSVGRGIHAVREITGNVVVEVASGQYRFQSQYRPMDAGGEPNTALIPRPKLEDDSYDWFARHEAILKVQRQLDPEIVLIGDSITHFWGGEPQAAIRNGPKAWAELFGTRRVLNLGFGWDRIQNVLWRLDHGELEGTHPKLIVVHIGTNNTAGTGNARDNSPAEIAEAIRVLCQRLHRQFPETRVQLMAVFPRGEKPDAPARATVAAINQLIAPLGQEPGIHYVDIGPRFLSSDGAITREVMPDFLHPAEKGYAIWANAIREEMKATGLAN